MKFYQPIYHLASPIHCGVGHRKFQVLVIFVALLGMISPAWMLVDLAVRWRFGW
jgi:hypothetical protein